MASASVAGADAAGADLAGCPWINRNIVVTGSGCSQDACKANWNNQAKADCAPQCAANTCQNPPAPCITYGQTKSIGFRFTTADDQTCGGGKRYFCKATLIDCKCKCQGH